MTRADLLDFREEGIDPARSANLAASNAAVLAWEKAHPWSLDDYLAFLESFEDIFGPFDSNRRTWTATDFRL